MNKKISVTVGIPVYNEGANIRRLLKSLYSQKCERIVISKIIVSSDGSSDNTIAEVRAFAKGKKIISVVDNKDRQGIARGLNQVLEASRTDILVTLDGDIQIKDRQFLEKLVAPIINEGADLTSSATRELKPHSAVAHSLYLSMKIKRILFNSFKEGDNLYTCFGLARAYSKRFYRELRYPVSIGNDMFSYLACVSKNMMFLNARESEAYYRLPETFTDHKKQSTRFVVSEDELTKYFHPELISREIKIPFLAIFKTLIFCLPILFVSPIDALFYCFIQVSIKILPNSATSQTWDMATTSKNL